MKITSIISMKVIFQAPCARLVLLLALLLLPPIAPQQPAKAHGPWSPGAAPESTAAGRYYVDSISGSDANSGTSPDRAWRTLAPLHTRRFAPGDIIHFRRGSSWTGGLLIDESGIEGNPITFTTYGAGDRPIIANPGNLDRLNNAITVYGNWIVLEGLMVRDANFSGVYLWKGADHNVVRDMEATNVGIGVFVNSQYNLITRNNIHDLNIVRNTPGGNDDFGAIGIVLSGSFNEVSHNTLINCIAPSYDFIVDGGAIEFSANDQILQGSYIHHNWAEGCAGFMELGGSNATVSDAIVAYNVSINNRWFALLNLTGTFAIRVTGLRIENNTIAQHLPRGGWGGYAMIRLANNFPTNTLLLRNNIFFVDGDEWEISSHDGYIHTNNLYYVREGGRLGLSLGASERVGDPLFISAPARDYRLQPGSPAIDRGANLGYSLDFDGGKVPAGAAPDLGAFEYHEGDVLIVDDTDPGFSVRSAQDPWQEYFDEKGQHYGGSHHYNRQLGNGRDAATWTFTVPRPGQYRLYAWWYQGDWRPTEVPYRIHHIMGQTEIRVNQQINGGQWNYLGTFGWSAQGVVSVSDDATPGHDVVADAILLAYAGPLPNGAGCRIQMPVILAGRP